MRSSQNSLNTYFSVLFEPNNETVVSDSDNHSGAEDEDHTRNRRKRRRKTKAAGPADGPPPPCAAGDTPDLESLSKNKRRKLKKKRHKEKLRALGLVPRSTALEFTYKQSEQEEEEEDGESSQKLKDVLDFLQSTQELYFSDRSHNATLPVSAVESLFIRLLDGPSHPALVSNLYKLRALLAQSDVERLNAALREFSRTSMLPSDETEAVCTLFHYWMTQVLPMKNEGTTPHSFTVSQIKLNS